MLHTDRNNFGISQADGETDDYNTTRLANNANFQELDKNTAKCNWEATSDPTVNDDASLGYSEGSVWHNITSGKRFILKDATEGAADWWQTYPPVGPIPAEADNLAKLGAAGEIQDSGVNVADLALKVIPAADGNLAGLDLETGDMEDSGIDPSTLARRVAEPTAGHVAGIDADGDPIDSGETVEDLADAIIKKHAAAADDNFASLSEKTTPTGAMKVPVNDGTYGFMTRQNFLLGVKGGINFITNSDFEGDTVGQAPAGWGTYKDAAQATPEDGTGGSPSVTFLTSDTVILNGGKSARITKPASNCQGEGVNFLFNVPVAYRAGMVRIQLPYVPVDAIATGDFTIWIYDVTNGALIQPTAYQVEGRTAGTPGAVVAEFQAPYNMAQGRLLWHVATTSASQLRVDVDEIQVGPGSSNYGGSNTDWAEYTPNVYEGSNDKNADFTTRSGHWKKIGDTIFIKLFLGGNSNARSGTGQFKISLPAGVVASISGLRSGNDDFAFSVASSVASGSILDLQFLGNCVNGSNLISIVNAGTGGVSYNDATLNPASGEINVKGYVKVTGWSSNCQMSSEAETRVVSASYSGQPTGTLAASYNIVKYPTKIQDTHGGYDPSTGIYTIKVPGIYRIYAQFCISKTNFAAGDFAQAFILKNAVGVSKRSDPTSGTISELWPTAEYEDAFVAGDQISIHSYCSTTGAVFHSDVPRSMLIIERKAGPTQIAASEKIIVRYSTNAGKSIANGGDAICDFEDKVIDTHGCVTTGANWKFTAPRHDFYKVIIKNLFTPNQAWTAGSYAHNKLYVSRAGGALTAYSIGHNYKVDATNTNAAHGVSLLLSDVIELNAGDYISPEISHGESTARTLFNDGSYNYIVITSGG